MIEDSKSKAFRPQPGAMLFDFWYPAIAASKLKRGQMKRQILLGMPVLLCRDLDGKVFALDDHCPHRGMPFSFGHFDGHMIECCYHGWKFDGQGKCRLIPSLPSGSDFKTERIRATHYDCAQADELVWVYM
ncbi:MAG: Rieske 2Fe-2S domain-containing protein, partial [Pyrinomonadaceae bacterium]